MGGYWSNRIDPSYKPNKSSLLNRNIEVCRKNFRFIRKISTSGHENQSVIWLAQNWDNDSEKFFVKQTNKNKLFRNQRIGILQSQLNLQKNNGSNKFLNNPLFAFQDYCFLYLVTEYIEGFTLEQVIREHIFTQQEAKYIITALVSIIQSIHQQKYALTQLNPSNILIQKKTGTLKLLQLINPLPIDQYYPSHITTPLNQYSAPQILAMDQVLAQSDYYSLGLILYYLMKNKPAIPNSIKSNRMAVLQQKIVIVKSDLPQGWKPEAADFLVKLLIKNPELRLGRYGSFQIRNHSWLQNFICSSNYCGIKLTESYFKEVNHSSCSSQPQNSTKNMNILDCSYEFQSLFQQYQHCAELIDQQLSYDSIQQQF